jgi:alkylation response protein AidB-like acyl-CoA dehydrogenase
VILIPRQEGVTTKIIKTSYSPTAGTAFITFDNVRVPVENTLGPEGGGIFVILSNFNHERWVMVCASARAQRMIVEECLKWVSQRKAFGKPLSSQAVVRAKLAAMIARAEAVQSWLENITYQMCNMVRKSLTRLGGGYGNHLCIYVSVVQRAVDQPCGTDRFPENVQYTMRAGYCKGCGATLWGARHHADGNGPFYRTCELSHDFGSATAFAKLSLVAL